MCMEMKGSGDLRDIAAVCIGDSDALGRLLASYEPLIAASVASVRASVSADEFEVRAEACYAFYRAALSFDTKQDHLTFGLYAKICIRNHLISKYIRPRRPAVAMSLDELYRSGKVEEMFPGTVQELPGDRLTETESLNLLYRKVREVLSSYELSVFHLWAEGYSVGEIAGHLHREEKSVSNALARCLAKLRKAL